MQSEFRQGGERNASGKAKLAGPFLFLLVGLVLSTVRVQGFSLLGPYADWMDRTNGFREPGDIGGPVELAQGYRWNVPVVTYAFDQEFLDYFGSNGVAAVEGAIQVLNDLPRASEIVLTNYPLNGFRMNYTAYAQRLLDLKSVALWALVEHLGLAQPTRYVFCLKRWDPLFLGPADEQSWPPGTIPTFIVERNYDPINLAPSHYINGNLYTGETLVAYRDPGFDGGWDVTCSQNLWNWSVVPIVVDPFALYNTAVADGAISVDPFFHSGAFYTGLTRDDAGGLRYLLSANTVRHEILPPGTRGHGNSPEFVNGAFRPGVEKITFVRADCNPRTGLVRSPRVSRFIDSRFVNGMLRHQEIERVHTHPDFLFSATDTGKEGWPAIMVSRTGTSNWWNSAEATGSGLQGPGVIFPPVKIAFHKRGAQVFTYDNQPANTYVMDSHWGSYDASTNPPVSYPVAGSGNDQITVRLLLHAVLPPTNQFGNNFYLTCLSGTQTWRLPVPRGGGASLEMSSDLVNWVPLAVVTNTGGVVEWFHFGEPSLPNHFRVVPQ